MLSCYLQLNNGETTFSLKNEDLKTLLPSNICFIACHVSKIKEETFCIQTTVVDQNTNTSVSAKGCFKVKNNGVQMQFAPFSPRYYKPHLNYTGFVSYEHLYFIYIYFLMYLFVLITGPLSKTCFKHI